MRLAVGCCGCVVRFWTALEVLEVREGVCGWVLLEGESVCVQEYALSVEEGCLRRQSKQN